MSSYKKTINRLIKKNITISVTESFTGGLLSSEIISQPGVSKIFNTGLITYSKIAKIRFLKINKNIIGNYGAVSQQVATLMVKNLKKLTKSKLCISTTGIAGPSGGNKKKPVGLVYIGIYFEKNLIILKKIFKGSRSQIQKKTIKTIFETIEELI